MKTKRIGHGYYETLDGRWQVLHTSEAWELIRKSTNETVDAFPTKRQALMAIPANR